jgi:hypothetical protein
MVERGGWIGALSAVARKVMEENAWRALVMAVLMVVAGLSTFVVATFRGMVQSVTSEEMSRQIAPVVAGVRFIAERADSTDAALEEIRHAQRDFLSVMREAVPAFDKVMGQREELRREQYLKDSADRDAWDRLQRLRSMSNSPPPEPSGDTLRAGFNLRPLGWIFKR